MSSRAFAFGAHCSNSLHGILSDDKYVTSYFCIFFFALFLCSAEDAFACPVLEGLFLFLLDVVFVLFFAVDAGAGTTGRFPLLVAAVGDE